MGPTALPFAQTQASVGYGPAHAQYAARKAEKSKQVYKKDGGPKLGNTFPLFSQQSNIGISICQLKSKPGAARPQVECLAVSFNFAAAVI
jgi:hypothetical protein